MTNLSGYINSTNDIISELEKKRMMLYELENNIYSSIEEKNEIK